MKKLILLAVTTALMSNVSFALPSFCTSQAFNSGHSVFGAASCGKGTMGSLNIFGKTKLDNTTVTGSTSVHGMLVAEHAKLAGVQIFGTTKFKNVSVNGELNDHGSLTAKKSSFAKPIVVYGALKLKQSKVMATVKVYGAILADNSSFAQNITMYSSYSKFDDSTMKSITMHSKYKTPKLVLKGDTKVNGSITFVGKAGVVVKGKHVVITGKIVNGSSS